MVSFGSRGGGSKLKKSATNVGPKMGGDMGSISAPMTPYGSMGVSQSKQVAKKAKMLPMSDGGMFQKMGKSAGMGARGRYTPHVQGSLNPKPTPFGRGK